MLNFQDVADFLGHVVLFCLFALLGPLLSVQLLCDRDENEPDYSLEHCCQHQHYHRMAQHEKEQSHNPGGAGPTSVVEGHSRPACLSQHLYEVELCVDECFEVGKGVVDAGRGGG